MVHYKVHYFNLRGRGEIIRLVLTAAGVEFEDRRVEFSEWPSLKPNTPLGSLPFVEIQDGDKKLVLSQSTAIARYLAKKYNLAGKGDEEQAVVDMYGDQVTDLLNEMAKIVRETDEVKKLEIRKNLQTEIVPRNLKLFEEKIAKSGSGFFVSSGLTWADLHLFNVIENLGEHKSAILGRFPHIKEMDRKIRLYPKIAEYISKRPVTEA